MFREQIHDFAFAFITPLRSNYHDIGHRRHLLIINQLYLNHFKSFVNLPKIANGDGIREALIIAGNSAGTAVAGTADGATLSKTAGCTSFSRPTLEFSVIFFTLDMFLILIIPYQSSYPRIDYRRLMKFSFTPGVEIVFLRAPTLQPNINALPIFIDYVAH